MRASPCTVGGRSRAIRGVAKCRSAGTCGDGDILGGCIISRYWTERWRGNRTTATGITSISIETQRTGVRPIGRSAHGYEETIHRRDGIYMAGPGRRQSCSRALRTAGSRYATVLTSYVRSRWPPSTRALAYVSASYIRTDGRPSNRTKPRWFRGKVK